MSIKKTELKVTINCVKCKTEALKAVSKLTGVDMVTVDGEKGTLTVVGSVDPVCIATKLKKAGIYAEITSVGPPKKPDPPKPPKPDEPKPCKPLPPCCNQCQLVAVSYTSDDGGNCSIM